MMKLSPKMPFRSPILDQSLITAIKSISPHLELDENSCSKWEHDQNLSSLGEYNALEPFLKPNKIALEIGPGMGRSIVFFSKILNWTIHAYEGDGGYKEYPINAPKNDDSFCGNIEQLKRVLEFNRVSNYDIFDRKEFNLCDLQNQHYDYVYSFYSVGYHWNLRDFWSDIKALLKPDGIGFFTVPLSFQNDGSIGKEPKLLEWKSINSVPTRILVVKND